MSSQIILNATNETCNHGWLHKNRIATIDYSAFHISQPRVRKTVALSLTLQRPDQFFEQGARLIDQARFDEAAAAFSSAVQLQWNFSAAHIELGNAYSALSKYDLALTAYTNALETDPTSTIAHYNTALTFTDLKDFPTAIEWIQRLIKINPDHQMAYTLHARILLATGQPENAIGELLLAAEISQPHDPDILVQAGNAYADVKQNERALHCYQRALKSDALHAQAYYAIARHQFTAGNLNAANLAIANSLNTRPNHAEAKALLNEIKKALTPKRSRRRRKPIQADLFPAETRD